jgi:hypothetical protein
VRRAPSESFAGPYKRIVNCTVLPPQPPRYRQRTTSGAPTANCEWPPARETQARMQRPENQWNQMAPELAIVGDFFIDRFVSADGTSTLRRVCNSWEKTNGQQGILLRVTLIPAISFAALILASLILNLDHHALFTRNDHVHATEATQTVHDRLDCRDRCHDRGLAFCSGRHDLVRGGRPVRVIGAIAVLVGETSGR